MINKQFVGINYNLQYQWTFDSVLLPDTRPPGIVSIKQKKQIQTTAFLLTVDHE